MGDEAQAMAGGNGMGEQQRRERIYEKNYNLFIYPCNTGYPS